MRIVTWNCNLSLSKKLDKLLELNADLYVVQECEQEIALPNSFQYIWRGHNTKKGLGVISSGLEISVQSLEDKFWTYFIPINIPSKSIRLLALWAYNHRASRFGELFNGSALSVINQLQTWLESSQSIVIGDFNNSVIWDKPEGSYNFEDINHKLNNLGLYSAYHKNSSAAFGSEPYATFFHTKNINKPYHIDYCFVEESLVVERVQVLDFLDWRKISDHVPVVVDIAEN